MWLSFFLLSGAAAGTLFCNRMDAGMKEAFGTLGQSFLSAAVLKKMDFGGLFFAVLRKRLPWLFFAFLVSQTAVKELLFSAMAAYLGFSSAVTVCALTMDFGVLGIIKYLALLCPQCAFYIPVMYVLTVWMPGKNLPLRPRPAAALTALVFLGITAESLVNPWVFAIFF